MGRLADRVVADLAERFATCFPRDVEGPRTVGREAEFPLVTPDGRAGDASRLWRVLVAEGCEPIRDRAPGGSRGQVIGVRGDGWECLVEVGRCTVEVVVGPRSTLNDLQRDLDRALAVILPAAHRTGHRLLGYGIQPRTPPSGRLLAPKRRYPVMTRATRGRWVRWTVTASDQVHVGLSGKELIPLLNLLNGLAGAVIALTANSSVYGGRAGRYASGREGLVEDVTGEPHRHGALPRAFTDVQDWVRFVMGFRCLFLPDGRGGFVEPARPMLELLGEGGALDLDTFLFHDHYVWPSARPRARLGTLEVRPACQQPADASWAPAALAVGLAEAPEDAAALLESAGSWEGLLRYRHRAVKTGLRAAEPIGGFLASVLDAAEKGLRRRGAGEQAMLTPLRHRLASRAGPADQARTALAREGMDGLVGRLALD